MHMSNYFIFISMIFCHIVDDYYLQGVLAKMKQKKNWDQHSIYRYDYVPALIAHGMSWSFMVMLPIAVTLQFNIGMSFVLFWFTMASFHAIIDDMKANLFMINLLQDQFLHIFQIIMIYLAYISNVF